ncbi:DotU family type IV/VI secretion system protein [Catenovulum sp. SM1970]|uniref:type IVB secretion system protein IcmH/DotU n=1 Tax=Marinifaba aquimaris TaxID=2741323 RepID=UPI001574393D|nr:type IVB secretion system protein IcmH/DotU [Marinifaba aquimaris]NTS75637.1 DotU family type IV/VI secretion system protein [Marinifaba aquimaris]
MSDDLFKTQIIPNPGGRRGPIDNTAASPAVPPVTPPSPGFNPNQAAPSQPTPMQDLAFHGENRILSSSGELLALAMNLRSLEPQNSIEQLRVDIEKLIGQFEQELAQKGGDQEQVLTSRYLICCLLDEFILSTPWGAEGTWSQQTLLSKYHNETWGGEKFFLIVDKLLEQAQRNLDLVELAYVCLSVGFRGKYKVAQDGEKILLSFSQKLYHSINQLRPVPRDLSPAWQGAQANNETVTKKVPSWLVLIGLAFVLSASYVGLLSNLKGKAEPIYAKLESIGWQDFITKAKSDEDILARVTTKLETVFVAEQESQILSIDSQDQMPVIRLTSSSLFGSGSSKVNRQALPDVNTLVEHIKQYADTVLVVGHTDSTGQADSNWVISRKRAEAIAAWLNTADSPIANVITRGVADTQPLYDDTNDKFKQSLNRRVELLLVLKGS